MLAGTDRQRQPMQDCRVTFLDGGVDQFEDRLDHRDDILYRAWVRMVAAFTVPSAMPAADRAARELLTRDVAL